MKTIDGSGFSDVGADDTCFASTTELQELVGDYLDSLLRSLAAALKAMPFYCSAASLRFNEGIKSDPYSLSLQFASTTIDGRSASCH